MFAFNILVQRKRYFQNIVLSCRKIYDNENVHPGHQQRISVYYIIFVFLRIIETKKVPNTSACWDESNIRSIKKEVKWDENN